jgi:hypothetical protein
MALLKVNHLTGLGPCVGMAMRRDRRPECWCLVDVHRERVVIKAAVSAAGGAIRLAVSTSPAKTTRVAAPDP